jgi:multidrug efflux pump
MKNTSFTDFFIHHPIFSWVINIVLLLLGGVAFFQLSTRQYPLTEGTQITIKTNIDLSTKVMEAQVTRLLEDTMASIQGIENIESETQKGESKIRLFFNGRSLDAAAADVREAVSRSQSKLPQEAEPVVTKGDVDAPSVMELALTGKDVPLEELFYTAEHTLKNLLESINGVATVEVSGGSDLRMDIILDPLKMGAYQVTASDVTRALKSHNFQRSAGRVISKDSEFILTTQACLKTPKEFEDIVVNKQADRLIRLSDIAKVNICPSGEDVKVSYNGKPAVSLTIRPQSNANPIEISKEVKKRIGSLDKTLPQGAQVHVAMDRATFIQESVNQVYKALFEAVFLVLLVILFFLRSFKASLIPLITIPISLIGTFFIMYTLGFTINVLSLLALVLAIGLVVDDAIVVLENIYRYIEQGKRPFQAAILGAREIRFSVIAMTLTLAAVYAPIAITPGLVGKVFKEFALTLAGAVIVSGFTALTLSPPMCARLLRPHAHAHKSTGITFGLSQKIEHMLSLCEVKYKSIISSLLGNKSYTRAVVFFALLFSLSSGLWGWYGLKKELSPTIDEGRLSVRFYAPPSRNLSYMSKRAPQIEGVLKTEPNFSTRLLTLQIMPESFAQMMLKPWGERYTSCQDIVKTLNEKMLTIQGLDGRAGCPSGSIISSRESQYPLSFRILTHRSEKELQKIGRIIRKELKKFPGIDQVDNTEIAQQSEYEIKVNRDRASQLGIDPDEVADTLQTLVRGSNIGRFEKSDKTYPVHVWVNEGSRNSLDQISSLFVKGRSQDNQQIMVPLREIISFEQTQGDPVINHYMKKRAYDIMASLKPGYSLGQTYLDFKKYIDPVLPQDYTLDPSGDLKRYFDERGSMYLIFGLAVLFIFLVMAAQFESLRDPIIIMLTVPLALGGGLISLSFLKVGSINVYSQIGLITLIGLITKHGILIVDFANQRKKQGLSVYEAIVEACQLRLRPILMTTFAMVLGSIPLALASGPGSEARQQIGMVIVGGMTVGTLFTLFVIPIIYKLIAKSHTDSGEETFISE